MLNRLVIVSLLIFAGVWWCYWVTTFIRAFLVAWINKREKRERRANAIRDIVEYDSLDNCSREGQLGKDTIDYLIYGDKDPRRGLRNSFAAVIAKRVYTWKEWEERDVDHYGGSPF